MSDDIRGMWMNGPMVVFGNLENVTTAEFEDAVIDTVNDVMELAENNPPSQL